ncbi:MAG TPA: aminotransferase class I/II-fold pyridoxal phosphate-dependent enzyme [Anaeromyxobacteraceae bacterium]|nr:aminotransferase class I/II-fold pyridoxal phosphate-dependent enzyme [Anaeromyxobacteraceae bacterium]
MTAAALRQPTPSFSTRLDAARAAGTLPHDLTESDPARCGLGWEPRELERLLAARAGENGPAVLGEAREAVASYLAGHGVAVPPDRVFFAPSRSAALRLALDAVGGADGEVLVPAPARPLPEPGEPTPRHRTPYRLAFEGAWRLDRRSIRRAIGPRTRAVVVGNPAAPTGAMLDDRELTFLDELGAARGLALVADEGLLDTAAERAVSVGRAGRALALHVSGLSGVCGLGGIGGAWIAVAGPAALADRAASRLALRCEAAPAEVRPALPALPALLARRGPSLERVRARLARNRAAIATASLREAPWTMQWGAGGHAAVIQVNPVQDLDALCLALLDEGVAVRPGALDGLPPHGHLVVSLLPEPQVFDAGLERLERALRRGW